MMVIYLTFLTVEFFIFSFRPWELYQVSGFSAFSSKIHKNWAVSALGSLWAMHFEQYTVVKKTKLPISSLPTLGISRY